MVIEYGTHQRPPTREEVVSEFNRTFQGVLYFIEEAPKVQINTNFFCGATAFGQSLIRE